MSYRNVQPSLVQFAVDRMGSQIIKLPTIDWTGTSIDLTGSVCHLWIAVPTPNQPIPISPQQLNPGSGYTFTATGVSFEVTEADLHSWGLGPGTYAGELLTTNDGGVTTDVLWRGTLVVNTGWLTSVY